MAHNEGDRIEVIWSWTPDCGALHVESNPVMLSLTCPDGLSGFAEGDT